MNRQERQEIYSKQWRTGSREHRNREHENRKYENREHRKREHNRRAHKGWEAKSRRWQPELRRKMFAFCLFTFLLGVLCGKIVFAEESGLLEQALSKEAGVDSSDSGGGGKEELQNGVEGRNGSSVLSVSVQDDWRLTLVNASSPMEEGYVPELAEIENHYYFDARAVSWLQNMLSDGREEGLDFWVCSAYRTIEKQTELYEDKVRRLEAEGMSHAQALREAGTEVAYPGTSEHGLGLAVDIVARDYQMLDEKQEQTEEQQWLIENCWKYGFILRYPTDKTKETGIIYEPWHYRYVGREAAKEIMEQGICLEEYLGKAAGEYE